ncbi:MAG: high frequency lysogenization protein HflD [Mariprofundaceae bacterium]
MPEPKQSTPQADHHAESPMCRRAIALAALTQAVYLVDGIARKGLADAEDSRTCLESIFTEAGNNQNPVAIYGNIYHLRTGLRIAADMLSGNDLPQTKALMTYSAGLFSLEKRLAKEPKLRQHLGDGMQRISKQRQYFGDAMHSNVIAAIADLYGETISTMKPRIIVRGKSEHLSQPANTQRVRALLLAGLRAAHLWHHHGGGHLTLLLRRKALLHEIKQLQQLASRPAA